jgi:hypothetical protein
MRTKIIAGDFVEHRELDFGIGQAAHEDEQGRWVVWRFWSGGKYSAGCYQIGELRRIGPPSPAQMNLRLDRRRR